MWQVAHTLSATLSWPAASAAQSMCRLLRRLAWSMIQFALRSFNTCGRVCIDAARSNRRMVACRASTALMSFQPRSAAKRNDSMKSGPANPGYKDFIRLVQESSMHSGSAANSAPSHGSSNKRKSLMGNCRWGWRKSSWTAQPERASMRKAKHRNATVWHSSGTMSQNTPERKSAETSWKKVLSALHCAARHKR